MLQINSGEHKVKDWFEFILDLNLLEQHLKDESAEPSGCSLIVQFLYHANLTEQIYNASLPPPPSKPPNAVSSTPSATTPQQDPSNQVNMIFRDL